MNAHRVIGFVVTVAVAGCMTTACAKAPPREDLVTKLQQRNDLTVTQARCVADGLYDGMPDAQPAIRRLTPSELRAVAKPENAGKVPVDVLQILRDVVNNCVPNENQVAGS